MYTYDPNAMPATMEEWEELIAYKFKEFQEQYDAAITAAKAQAKAQYEAALSANPELKQTLADYEANAVAMVEPPKTRPELEATYGCYKPQPEADITLQDHPVDQNHAIYMVKDGLYSVAAQDFISGNVNMANVIELTPPTKESLRKTLEFYSLPVGDCLLTQEEVIARKR